MEARRACERLGFCLEAVLRDHVKDASGKVHDLFVMSCGLDEVSEPDETLSTPRRQRRPAGRTASGLV